MQRRLLKVYTGLNSKPYRLALRYYDFAPKEVIEVYKYSSLPDLACGAVEILSTEKADFFARLCEIDDKRFMNSKHKTRRYISDNRDHLYINSPHLTQQHSRHVNGYWIATNIGRLETLAIVGASALSAGVTRRSITELLV